MQVRISALLFAVAAVAAMDGCTDTTAFRAQFANEERPLTAYALNGTAPTLPAAVSVRGGSVERVDPTFRFDLAFDMDDFGVVTVYSARRVAGELASVNRVGFQIDSMNLYEQITRAPTSGYAYDTALVLSTGHTLLVDVIEPSCQGQSFLGFNIRAKLTIDSVDAARRAVFFRMLPNPNCGFRSLLEGIPKD
jgi:hypothetical protein